MQRPDVYAEDHGSVIVLHLSRDARRWIQAHVEAPLWWGTGIAVEPRYFVPLVEGMRAEGFTIYNQDN